GTGVESVVVAVDDALRVRPAVDGVVPRGAVQEVGSGSTDHRVVPGSALEPVVPRAGVQQRVVPRAPVQDVSTDVTAARGHQVAAPPPELLVITGDPEQTIEARASEQDVVATEPDQLVIPPVPADHVVPTPAEDDVVA